MTAQARENGDPRVSPARVAVVQFEPRVGVENLKSNAVAVERRLTAAADGEPT